MKTFYYKGGTPRALLGFLVLVVTLPPLTYKGLDLYFSGTSTTQVREIDSCWQNVAGNLFESSCVQALESSVPDPEVGHQNMVPPGAILLTVEGETCHGQPGARLTVMHKDPDTRGLLVHYQDQALSPDSDFCQDEILFLETSLWPKFLRSWNQWVYDQQMIGAAIRSLQGRFETKTIHRVEQTRVMLVNPEPVAGYRYGDQCRLAEGELAIKVYDELFPGLSLWRYEGMEREEDGCPPGSLYLKEDDYTDKPPAILSRRDLTTTPAGNSLRVSIFLYLKCESSPQICYYLGN